MDRQTPTDAIRDVSVALTHEAELLAAQALRLRLVHEKAVARERAPGRPPERTDD